MSTWVLLSPHWPSRTPQHPGTPAGLGVGSGQGGTVPPRHPAGRRLRPPPPASSRPPAERAPWNLEQPRPLRLAPLCSMLTRQGLAPRSRRGTLRWAPGAASAGTRSPGLSSCRSLSPCGCPSFHQPGPVLRAESPQTNRARPTPARGRHPAGGGATVTRGRRALGRGHAGPRDRALQAVAGRAPSRPGREACLCSALSCALHTLSRSLGHDP